MLGDALIGYTGTIGRSLLDVFPDIDNLYNSKNINNIRGKSFETLYIAGVSANKWFANNNSEEDMRNINRLLEALSSVKANKVFLFSTIDIDYFKEEPYSINRKYFEDSVKNIFSNLYIIRLPGLIGKHIKKNFVYDCKHLIPKFFKDPVIKELNNFYGFDGNVYILKDAVDRKALLDVLEKNLLSSLRFSSKGSIYQFFNLSNLKELLKFVEKDNAPIFKVSSYPISTDEICTILGLNSELLGCGKPVIYDKITEHCLMSKEEVIDCIKKYYAEG